MKCHFADGDLTDLNFPTYEHVFKNCPLRARQHTLSQSYSKGSPWLRAVGSAAQLIKAAATALLIMQGKCSNPHNSAQWRMHCAEQRDNHAMNYYKPPGSVKTNKYMHTAGNQTRCHASRGHCAQCAAHKGQEDNAKECNAQIPNC